MKQTSSYRSGLPKWQASFKSKFKKIPKKILREQILCIAVSLILSAVVFFSSQTSSIVFNGNHIKRSSYGSSNRSLSLEVSGLKSGQDVPLNITVSPKRYSREEADRVFKVIVENIEGIIVDDDQSLASVSHDLNLVTRLKDYGVELSWNFYPEVDDPEDYRKYRHLIEADGRVRNQDIPEGTVITGYLSLIMSTYIVPESDTLSPSEKDYTKIKYHSEAYKIYVNVVPACLSEYDLLLKQLNQKISDINLSSLGNDDLILPTELEGLKLSYHDSQDYTYLVFPFLGIIAAFSIYMRQDSLAKEEKKKRESMLMLDYSDLVSKLMVYTGAGLTIKNSFMIISENYDRLIERKLRPDRPLYQELRTLCYQFHRNMPESEVYIDLGKRINLKSYTKLVSLIEQNRKTGTKNLRSMLELEMNDAFEQRKTTAKRLGEEAGTKLLLPLFLLLAIVMVIIIVPALTAIK